MIKQEIILIIIGTLFLCIPTSAQNTDTTATSATLQRLDLRITNLVGKRDSLDGMISPLSRKADSLRAILNKARNSQLVDSEVTIISQGRIVLREEPVLVSKRVVSTSPDEKLLAREISNKYVFVERSDGTRGWAQHSYFKQSDELTQFVVASIDEQLLLADEKRAIELRNYKESVLTKSENAIAQQRRLEEIINRASGFRADLRSAGIPLIVKRFNHTVNSAGGVEPKFSLENISSRSFKYISISLRGFNPVGDPLTGTISGEDVHIARLVGPIESGEIVPFSFEDHPLFYHRATRCIEIRKIEIEFMDGGKFTMVDDLVRARESVSDYRVFGGCAVK